MGLTDPASTPVGAATAFEVAAAAPDEVAAAAEDESCASATAERTEKRRVILNMVKRVYALGTIILKRGDDLVLI